MLFRPGGAGPQTQVLIGFVDQQRDTYGVEPICRVLQIAPSGYRRHAAQQRTPELRCARAKQDATLLPQIHQVWQSNMQVYGADKVWHQLNRERVAVASCTVERLMGPSGLRGVRVLAIWCAPPSVARLCHARWTGSTDSSRQTGPTSCGSRTSRTFQPSKAGSTWAFVIDVYIRRIVGWRQSSSMPTDFVLDALEQALYDRQPERADALIHHSDRGSQYVSIRYSERVAEGSIEPSVSSKGDRHHNALAETINGLCKAELIHCRSPWKTKESLELATLEWV